MARNRDNRVVSLKTVVTYFKVHTSGENDQLLHMYALSPFLPPTPLCLSFAHIHCQGDIS